MQPAPLWARFSLSSIEHNVESGGGRVLQANYRANEEHALPQAAEECHGTTARGGEEEEEEEEERSRMRMQNPTKCAVRATERFMTRSVSEPARGRLAHHPAGQYVDSRRDRQ